MDKVIGIIIIAILCNNIITRRKKEIMIIESIITMYIILSKLLLFNQNNNEYQDRWEINNYLFGLDGISLGLISLVAIIEPILILIIREKELKLIPLIKIIKLITIIIFYTLDLLIFFIGFEIILIPIFYIITKFGSKYYYFLPRLEAGIRFIIYTMIGSIFMLIGIILLYFLYGSSSYELLLYKISDFSSNKLNLLRFVWIFFFYSFLIKLPIFPFHTWLPLAHSDAPTIGSIILAAILLKIASFGIIRYSLSLFTSSSLLSSLYDSFLPFLFILSLFSILSSSLLPLRGLFDFKKIIAYSSIIHMNISIFGFFSSNLLGLIGSSYLIFTHAFVSSSLFLLIGFLYNRYHSRSLLYFQGLTHSMPLFSFFFLFFILANISLPITSPFLPELFILISSFLSNPFLSILLLISLFFSSSFLLWLAIKILFGSYSSYLLSSGFKDLSLLEFLSLFPFFLFSSFFSFFPQSIISLLTLPLIL